MHPDLTLHIHHANRYENPMNPINSFLWAQLNVPPSHSRLMLNSGEAMSKKIAAAWDYAWEVSLNQGGLYRVLVNFGITVAVICLLFWCLKFARQWMQEEATSFWSFQEIIYPVLVILLLSNGGSNLAKLSTGMRSMISSVNSQVIEIVAVQLDLDAKLAEIADYAGTQAQLITLRQQCNTIIDHDKLETCLQEYSQAADAILQAYKTEHANTDNSAWLEALKKQAAEAAKSPNEVLQVTTLVAVNVAMSPILSAVEIFMLALQVCFQHLIEVSMLLIAILGPIAIGASLMPFGAKPIFAWLTGFLSLGLGKLSYNVICGLMAIAIHKLGPTDTLVSAIFLGLFSPLLAVAIARSGWMAVWSGITAASTAITGGAITPLLSHPVGSHSSVATVASRQSVITD